MPEIDFPIVPTDCEAMLNDRQRTDYRSQREDFIRWLLALGKDPDSGQGYSYACGKRTAFRCGRFDRFVWDRHGNTYPPTHDHADKYLGHLIYEDYSESDLHNMVYSIKCFFKWRHHALGGELYETDLSFPSPSNVQPPEFLTIEERQAIRAAALEYSSIAAYSGLTPSERSKWERLIAQRIGKPVEDVEPADWERVNDWKYTSLSGPPWTPGFDPSKSDGRPPIGWTRTTASSGFRRTSRAKTTRTGPSVSRNERRTHWKSGSISASSTTATTTAMHSG